MFSRDILDSLQRTSATAASSATQELDDLMASLSDMKVFISSHFAMVEEYRLLIHSKTLISIPV